MSAREVMAKDWARILDLVPQIVGYIGTDLRYHAANRAFEDWMQLPRGGMIGADVRTVVTNKFGPEVFASIEPKLKAALRGERVSYEREYESPGERRRILVEYTPDLDDSGGVLGTVMVISDVTERHRSEEKLRANEQLFRGLSSSNPAGIFRADLEGKVSYVNARLEHDWQLSAEECMAHGWMRRVHADDLDSLLEGWRDATAAAEDYEKVYRIVLDSKEVRWIHGRSSPILGADGTPTGSVGTVQDITEERRARARSRESEDRFQRVFEDAPVAMAISDPDTMRIIVANREAAKMFGYPVEELRGMSISAISHPDDMELDHEYAQQVLAGDSSGYVMEKRFRNRSGQELQGLLKVSAVRGDGEGQRLILGMVVDLTKQRRLEMQLRQKMKMEAIGQLAGGVAHDFNNLLMIINSYAELLVERHGADSDVGKKAHAIEDAGKRAAQLTQQLLAFSRQQHLQPKVLDLNLLVKNSEKMLSRLVRADIQVVTNFSARELRVKADPGQLEQVMMNLVINARDAMPHGGKIEIVTASKQLGEEEATQWSFLIAPGPYVELRVADEGVGMTAEVKAHIFEPFFTTKEAGKGTGLGLSTVYGIVKQSGGWIFCESEVGNGTTFRVLLPEVDGDFSRDSAVAKKSASVGTGTILLVEDEAPVRELLAETLSGRGYQVFVAANGEDALELASRHLERIDLLVTDIVMPQMGGQKLARALWQKKPQLKVLFMSGYVEGIERDHDLGDRNRVLLQKPFSPDVFARAVNELLNR